MWIEHLTSHFFSRLFGAPAIFAGGITAFGAMSLDCAIDEFKRGRPVYSFLTALTGLGLITFACVMVDDSAVMVPAGIFGLISYIAYRVIRKEPSKPGA